MSEVETNLGNEKYYDPYRKTSSGDLKKSDQHHKKSDSTNIILTEYNKGNEDDEKQSRKRAMTTPYGNTKDSNLDNEHLPSGWEQRQTPEGLYYYVDHNSKTTQWHHPNYDHIYPHHQHSKSRSSTDAPKSNTTNNNISTDNNENNDNKEKKAKKRRNSISSSGIEDEYIRILRTPPKRVKIGYTTILFSSHPSLTLQVSPTAQLACDWLNSLRNYNFKIEQLSLNLNKSLMKGLNLWMNIFKDNHQTKHSYDKNRKWQYKIFGLSSIAATLDPHIEGNSKTTKIMNDFMIWRTSLSSDIPIIYTLSHSRTYACILVIYQSLSAREIPDNTNTILSDKTDITHPEKEGDLSYHRHHRHHHKSKDDKEKSKDEKSKDEKSKDEKSKDEKDKSKLDIKDEKEHKDEKEKEILKEEKDIKERDEKEKLKEGKDLKERDKSKDNYEKNLPNSEQSNIVDSHENKKEEKEDLEKDEKKYEARDDSKNKSSLSDNYSNQNIEKKDEKKELHSKWIP